MHFSFNLHPVRQTRAAFESAVKIVHPVRVDLKIELLRLINRLFHHAWEGIIRLVQAMNRTEEVKRRFGASHSPEAVSAAACFERRRCGADRERNQEKNVRDRETITHLSQLASEG